MTKGEYIELIYLQANGGDLDVDANVQRDEIGVKFNIAFSYALQKFHFQSRAESLEDIRFLGYGGAGTVEHGFLSTVLATPSKDSDRNLLKITLAKKAKFLAKNRGVEYVFPKEGDYTYVRINSPAEISGMPLGRTVYYWTEDNSIYLKNTTQVCDHYVRYIIDPDDMENDDEIPIPAGAEMDIVKMMSEWFLVQKQVPEDVRPNDVSG